MNELWRPIPNLSGYVASSLGRIGSFIRYSNGKILTCNKPNSKGYPRYNLNGKVYFAHVLVAITFLDNPYDKPQVNHKNGIKTDNRVENLEWVTNQENRNHAVDNNLIAKGFSLPQTKLSREDKIEIIRLYNSGMKQSEIAKTYDVVQQTISKIIINS